MPFTHYPKNQITLLGAWVWPRPPVKPNFLNFPPFDELNLLMEPLGPGETVVLYHEAQNFTRFFGTLAADQPLELVCSFSNDEVAADGSAIDDDNLKTLNYDGEALRQLYSPDKPKGSNGSKFFITIFGRWICVELTNKGDKPVEKLRAFIRCSVF